MKPEYLFAYGTLLSDHPSSEVASAIAQLKHIGPATIRGYLFDLGEYPGAVIDPTATTLVHGEVYELPNDEQFLAKLDAYEEYDPSSPSDSLFVREKCIARGSDDRIFECWAYRYNREIKRAQMITSGQYQERRVG
jgi:gamma-glutamylcyclotransferase (GGCT)/AIG2-like uncharacterized protein YtfP